MKKIILSALCFIAFSSTSLAQSPPCGPRSEMIKFLTGSRIAESIFATGKVGKETIVEFFVNPESGTFTVLITRVRSRGAEGKIAGNSCLAIGGSEFQVHEMAPKAKPSKHTGLRFFQLQ